jgi:hypothetical protein
MNEILAELGINPVTAGKYVQETLGGALVAAATYLRGAAAAVEIGRELGRLGRLSPGAKHGADRLAQKIGPVTAANLCLDCPPMVAAVLYKAGVPASFKAGFVADSLAWGSLTHFYLGMDLSAQADPAAAWHEEVSRQYVEPRII